MTYDIFIPCAEKDQVNLDIVLEKIFKNLSFNQIYVCSPNKIKHRFTSDGKVNFLLDGDVFPYDRSKISFRPNWTYQQILKMFFNKGSEDYYLSVDADVFFLKPMDWFEEGKPIWRYGEDQMHNPYFLCNQQFFGLRRSLEHTGIGDIGFFNKKICNNFLEYCNVENPEKFLDLFASRITPYCQFSEFETYANYVNEFYPDMYKFKRVNFRKEGRRLDFGQCWKPGELRSLVQESEGLDFEVLQAHTWKI